MSLSNSVGEMTAQTNRAPEWTSRHITSLFLIFFLLIQISHPSAFFKFQLLIDLKSLLHTTSLLPNPDLAQLRSASLTASLPLHRYSKKRRFAHLTRDYPSIFTSWPTMYHPHPPHTAQEWPPQPTTSTPPTTQIKNHISPRTPIILQ